MLSLALGSAELKKGKGGKVAKKGTDVSSEEVKVCRSMSMMVGCPLYSCVRWTCWSMSTLSQRMWKRSEERNIS